MAWSMSANLGECITSMVLNLLSSDSNLSCSSTQWKKIDVSLTYGSNSSKILSGDTSDLSTLNGSDGTILLKSNISLDEDDMTITDVKVYSDVDSSGDYILALEDSSLSVPLNNDSGDVLYVEIEVDITNSLS